MIPDVVDAASLKNGIRREELFYSFFVFGNKFSSGVTLGISTGIYKYWNDILFCAVYKMSKKPLFYLCFAQKLPTQNLLIAFKKMKYPSIVSLIQYILFPCRLAGYDQLACEQPWTVPLLFKLLVSCPPVIFILISLIFLWRYPITEAKRAEIKEKLQSRR